MLYQKFLTHGPRRVAALERAVSQQRLADAAMLSHSLKTVFASLGADACRRITEELASAMKNGKTSDMDPALQVLKREVDQLMPLIGRHMGF